MHFEIKEIQFNPVTDFTDITGTFGYGEQYTNQRKQVIKVIHPLQISCAKPTSAILKLRSCKLSWMQKGFELYLNAAKSTIDHFPYGYLSKLRVIETLEKGLHDSLLSPYRWSWMQFASFLQREAESINSIIPHEEHRLYHFMDQAMVGLIGFANKEMKAERTADGIEWREAYEIPCDRHHEITSRLNQKTLRHERVA